MMITFIVAVLFVFSEASVIISSKKYVTIRNINYERETLKNGVNNPYQLAIDHDTNTLFFSYTARSDQMFRIAYLNLKNSEYGVVSGIHGGFANAVNSKDNIVYMGGEDGIYQFNYDTKTAMRINNTDNVNIWQMFYKDGLYYTTYPEEKAYFYKDGQIVEVPELKNIRVITIALNNENNIVYSNSSGVFVYNKATGNATYMKDLIASGFSADINGNLYFATSQGRIYYINDKKMEVEELVEIDNIYGVAIESNGDIIYASEESIIRLRPTKPSSDESESN